MSVVPAPKAISTVKVRVRAPFRVAHEGVAYSGGKTLDAPADSVTDLWIKSGWVERVPVPRKGK
jgi:hypothetical protein